MEAIFLLVIAAWVLCGCVGVFRCKNDGVNWFMAFFLCFAPILAIVAEICGLLD